MLNFITELEAKEKMGEQIQTNTHSIFYIVPALSFSNKTEEAEFILEKYFKRYKSLFQEINISFITTIEEYFSLVDCNFYKINFTNKNNKQNCNIIICTYKITCKNTCTLYTETKIIESFFKQLLYNIDIILQQKIFNIAEYSIYVDGLWLSTELSNCFDTNIFLYDDIKEAEQKYFIDLLQDVYFIK